MPTVVVASGRCVGDPGSWTITADVDTSGIIQTVTAHNPGQRAVTVEVAAGGVTRRFVIRGRFSRTYDLSAYALPLAAVTLTTRGS